MKTKNLRTTRRTRRRRGIRKRVSGTAERPRLAVFRSAKHLYAQIIDDESGVTLCEASTRGKGVREELKSTGNIEAAKKIGAVLAERAAAKNIKRVSFDRGGYKFHGRIKGLADAAREAGLEF